MTGLKRYFFHFFFVITLKPLGINSWLKKFHKLLIYGLFENIYGFPVATPEIELSQGVQVFWGAFSEVTNG